MPLQPPRQSHQSWLSSAAAQEFEPRACPTNNAPTFFPVLPLSLHSLSTLSPNPQKNRAADDVSTLNNSGVMLSSTKAPARTPHCLYKPRLGRDPASSLTRMDRSSLLLTISSRLGWKMTHETLLVWPVMVCTSHAFVSFMRQSFTCGRGGGRSDQTRTQGETDETVSSERWWCYVENKKRREKGGCTRDRAPIARANAPFDCFDRFGIVLVSLETRVPLVHRLERARTDRDACLPWVT